MRQPWLNDPGTTAKGPPDDFSPRSATMGLRGAALALALGLLVLAAGRSGQILDAAYGLPVAPGTEALIAAAEAWAAAMESLGIPDALSAIRRVLTTGR